MPSVLLTMLQIMAVQGLSMRPTTLPRARAAVLCSAAPPTEVATPATTNKLISKARDNQSVLKIAADEGRRLGGVNIATAMHRLAAINKRNRVGRDALLRDGRYKALIDDAAAKSTEFTPRATADVLWSCATMQDFPPQLLMPVLTSVAMHLDYEDFAARHLSTVVWSLAKLSTKPTRLLERIEVQAIPLLGEMNDQNVANLLWGFAKLNYQPSQLLPLVSDMLLAPGMLERAKAVEVTDLAFALGELGAPGEFDELMLALSARASPDAIQADFSSRQLVKIIAAFAELEATARLPEGRLDGWVDRVRIEHAQKSLMARDQRTLEEALTTLDIECGWIKEFEMIGTWSVLAGGGSKPTRRVYTDDELRAVFEAIDTDKSGDIDLEELKTAIRKVSPDAEEEDIKKMLNFGDTDGDAEVSFDEFKEIMNKGVPVRPGSLRPEA